MHLFENTFRKNKPEYFFVYGTLKTKLSAGNYFSPYGAELVSVNAKTCKSNYLMFSLLGTKTNEQWYPIVVDYREYPEYKNYKTSISGHIYKIDQKKLIRMLDQYEGYPRLYTRKKQCVVDKSTGVRYNCWIYFYQEDLRLMKEYIALIPSGEWDDKYRNHKLLYDF